MTESNGIGRLIADITGGARAAHAFIVEGRAGEARDEFIQNIARGLLCQDQEVLARPCGRCPSCRQVAAGTSLDVVHMNKSIGSGKSARATYKVDDAGAFIERLSMGRYGRFLIGIIDEADILSEVVQNKLLKTLEEPGSDTVILIGAANRDNLLSTVRSRCSEIRMSDWTPEYTDEASHDSNQALLSIVRMLEERNAPFHQFRTAVDKSIKTREDALVLLDLFEDDLHQQMRAEWGLADDAKPYGEGSYASGNGGADRFTSTVLAVYIEIAAICRMDIRRDMNPGKALRRLWLELH